VDWRQGEQPTFLLRAYDELPGSRTHITASRAPLMRLTYLSKTSLHPSAV